MPAWLSLLLTRVIVPLAIELLRKSGAINAAEALAIKFGLAVKKLIDSVEVTPAYPGDEDKTKKPETIQVWQAAQPCEPDDGPPETKTFLGLSVEPDYSFGKTKR